MRILFFLFFFSAIHPCIYAASLSPLSDEESRQTEGKKFMELCEQYAKFYELLPHEEIKEITDVLLQSPLVKESRKQAIRESNRRIFIFTYPSDGLQIKGLVSFIPQPHENPMIVFLRGGNRIFGLLNPACDFLCLEKYTVITTTYRGGISEGTDEFGGEDVNDVKHLIDFIPKLEHKLNILLQNEKMYLMGGSRGGMQMFLALVRFPELQTRFAKVVSLSGLLDMHACLETRSDMKQMFIDDFGFTESDEEWINTRDPLLTAESINPNLPVLIIQGTADNRVGLDQGYHMVSKLQANGSNVTYWEIEGGDHCLSNHLDRTSLILQWLEM